MGHDYGIEGVSGKRYCLHTKGNNLRTLSTAPLCIMLLRQLVPVIHTY